MYMYMSYMHNVGIIYYMMMYHLECLNLSILVLMMYELNNDAYGIFVTLVSMCARL